MSSYLPEVSYPVPPLTVDWGDGNVTQSVDVNAIPHTYANSGTYTVIIRDRDGRMGYSTVSVVLQPKITGWWPRFLDTDNIGYSEVFLEVENITDESRISINGGDFVRPSNIDLLNSRIKIVLSQEELVGMLGPGGTNVDMSIVVRTPNSYDQGPSSANTSYLVSDPVTIEVGPTQTKDNAFSSEFSNEFQIPVSGVSAAVPNVQSLRIAVPSFSTLSEMQAWVGTDQARAQAFLDDEHKKVKPRVDLLRWAAFILHTPQSLLIV